MCEAHVYLKKNGEEELLLESVYLIEPEGDRWRFENIFGEQKVLRAAFKVLALSEGKILLEVLETG
jgi:predicted RNA-binding protein